MSQNGVAAPRPFTGAATPGRRAPAAHRRPAAPNCRRRRSGGGRPRPVPRVGDGIEDLPGPDDLVAAGEQRRVADHAVEEQRLVGVGRVDRERAAVAEVHVHAADVQPGSRHLRAEAERIPSSGWTRIASTFGSICGAPARPNRASGARRNWTAISVTRAASALPVERRTGRRPIATSRCRA